MASLLAMTERRVCDVICGTCPLFFAVSRVTFGSSLAPLEVNCQNPWSRTCSLQKQDQSRLNLEKNKPFRRAQVP